jgi:gliding motility-associated-like protein
MRPLLLFLFSFFAFDVHTQLVLDNSQTVEYYVQNVLLGEGVTASNITFNGMSGNAVYVQVGSFNSTNANVGLNSGMIMANGNVQVAQGPNSDANAFEDTGLNLINGADPDLNSLTNGAPFNDWAILEFDFIPTGDTLSFRYVFASEEYPEFVGGNFNDVFAFFINGPGINGTYSNNAANIALIPGTNIPVSVNNVNANDNNAYYLSNGDGQSAPQNGSANFIQFDGMTVALTATAVVQCGETYHFKIVIADVTDSSYDSAVFIEENSFQSSPNVQLAVNSSIVNQNNTFFEACGVNELVISRTPGASLDDLVEIEIVTSGTATSGIDYEALPTSVQIPVGEVSVTIPLVVFNDLLPEADETFNIDVTATTSCSITNLLIELIIRDELPAPSLTLADTTICPGQVVTIVPEIGPSTGANTFLWSTGATTQTISLQPTVNTTVTLTMSNDCTIADVTASCDITVLNATELSATLTQTDFLIQCSDSIALNPTVIGGTEPYEFSWKDESQVALGIEEDYIYRAPQLQGGSVTFLVSDFCNRLDSVMVNVIIDESPLDMIVSMPDSICLGADLNISATVSNTDGPFQWFLNDLENNGGSWTLEPANTEVYTIAALDECGRSAEYTQVVDVSFVESSFSVSDLGGQEFLFVQTANGCEDGNCDFLWIVDGNEIGGVDQVTYRFTDRASVFLFVTNELGCQSQAEWQFVPSPLIFIPNAFTPNGDGINDAFRVEGGPFVDYRLTVFNSWGDVVYDSRDIEQVWTGNVKGGEYFCPDGIYNFRVVYQESNLISVEKTGFITILR